MSMQGLTNLGIEIREERAHWGHAVGFAFLLSRYLHFYYKYLQLIRDAL